MFIDFHTHIFPDKIASATIGALASNANHTPFANGTSLGLISEMDEGDFDISVNLPVITKPTQFDSILKFALKINEEYKNSKRKIISFAGIHPECEDISGKMLAIKNAGIKGVKIHPDYQESFINCNGYVDILKCAKDLDLIVVTHAGIDDGYAGKPVRCPPELVLEVIEKVNHHKFVLAHFGGNKYYDKVYELLAGKNVYFDTAFNLKDITKEQFVKMLQKHGEDKILFATDSPWAGIKEEKERVLSYNLPKSVQDKIFYKNALNLLDIKE